MGNLTLKSTLQNAALRKEKEVRRVPGSAFRGGGTDSGAGVNVSEEGSAQPELQSMRDSGQVGLGQGIHDLHTGLALLENP